MVMDEVIDLGRQFFHAPECASANGLLGNDVEPDLNLVKPGSVGRRQMDMETRVQGQPSLHPGMLVSGIVIDDQMNLQILRDIRIDMLQEVEVVLMAVPLLAFCEDLARGDIERGKERQGAVADIVMSDPFDIAQAHRQDGLSPVQGLDLALFVNTEDQGVLRGIQVQADDIPDLLDEKGIGGDFKMPLSMRLQAESLPDPLDSRRRYGGFLGHRADRPVCPTLRFSLECLADEFGDLFVGDRAGPAGTQLIMQASQALFPITPPPQGDGLSAVVDFGGNLPIAQALGRHKDNPGSGDQAIRQGSRADDGVQFLYSLLGKHNGLPGPSCSHGRPPSGRAHDNDNNLFSQVIYETIH